MEYIPHMSSDLRPYFWLAYEVSFWNLLLHTKYSLIEFHTAVKIKAYNCHTVTAVETDLIYILGIMIFLFLFQQCFILHYDDIHHPLSFVPYFLNMSSAHVKSKSLSRILSNIFSI